MKLYSAFILYLTIIHIFIIIIKWLLFLLKKFVIIFFFTICDIIHSFSHKTGFHGFIQQAVIISLALIFGHTFKINYNQLTKITFENTLIKFLWM